MLSQKKNEELNKKQNQQAEIEIERKSKTQYNLQKSHAQIDQHFEHAIVAYFFGNDT